MMLLELSKYKGASKEESTSYVWRIELDLYQEIKDVAAENQVRPSIVMRYIIDWACSKMDEDEMFREHILEVTLKKNRNRKPKKRAIYLLPKEINNKLMKTDEKYRIYNINFFAVESAKIFFQGNGK